MTPRRGSSVLQYACTLFTTPTTRQSVRALASAPVWQFWATVLPATSPLLYPFAEPSWGTAVRAGAGHTPAENVEPTTMTRTSRPAPPPPTAIGMPNRR